MNRFVFAILATILLSIINVVAVAQTESASSASRNRTDVASKPQIEFHGLTAVAESDALELIRESFDFLANRSMDSDSVDTAAKALVQVLQSRGYAHAKVTAFADEKGTVKFFVNEGARFPIVETRFDGNKTFSERELQAKLSGCLVENRSAAANNYDRATLDWCARKLGNYIRNAGYLQAQLRHTVEVTERGYSVSLTLEEGQLYRLGKTKIDGTSSFSEAEIRSKFSLREGDLARMDSISKWLFEDLKNLYGEFGFIEYTVDVTPSFKQNKGIVDLEINIEEGKQYSLRSITFVGDLIKGMNLEDLLLLKPGNTYNQRLFRDSVARLNDTDLFEPVDADRDVQMKIDFEEALVQVVITLKKRQ